MPTDMDSAEFRSFFSDFSRAITNQEASFFIGAGFSQAAGYLNWRELLREIAYELHLDVDREDDLVAIAQYHRNFRGGRAEIHRTIMEQYTKEAQETVNHPLIASIPVSTYWTTNYDTLIEDSIRKAGKTFEVNAKDVDLIRPNSRPDVTIYKMHGTVNDPEQAVLTKEDYETYVDNRPLLQRTLQADLINKTFLFIGFSFTDPNIDYILSRVRVATGNNQRNHYAIIKKPVPKSDSPEDRANYDYELVKFKLRVGDLSRYKITTLAIENYEEITTILSQIKRLSFQNNIFVSGSAATYGPTDQSSAEKLLFDIGSQIIIRGYNLVNGFGLGVGGHVIAGAMNEFYRGSKSKIGDRAVLRPFPQTFPEGVDGRQMWEAYRQDMLNGSGYAVFVYGNKLEGDAVVAANGVRREYEIALEANKFVIPVGATGYVAEELWAETVKNLDRIYPGVDVERYFQTLGDQKSAAGQIIDAIFSIIRESRRIRAN